MRWLRNSFRKENPEDPVLWKRSGKIDLNALDQVLENGLRGSSYIFIGRIYSKNCKVELQPGKTKDDLIAFFSMILPCPAWDAFVAADSKGIVKITAPTWNRAGALETLRK